MGEPDLVQRLRISLQLKAARHLAGRRQGRRAIPLPVSELADHALLVENEITQNRLEEIEQMKVDARPMEIEKIGQALGIDIAGLGGTPEPTELEDASAEQLVTLLRNFTATAEQLLGKIGRDYGRRDLRSRHARDPKRADPPAAASGSPKA